MKEGNDRLVAKEYRLIPLEAEAKSDNWQLKSLVKQAWNYKRIGVAVLGVVFMIGLLVALTKPDEYQVKSIFLVEASTTGSQAGDLLQNYGGLLGLGGNMLDQSNTIRSDLYPDITNSLPFQLELIEQEIHFSSYDTTVDIYTFFTQVYKPKFYHTLKKYTVGLNSLERQIGNNEAEPLVNEWREDEIFDLPSSQRAVARGMREIFELSIDGEKLTIEGWLPDPQAASQFVNEIRKTLSEYIISYKTEKAMQDLEFIERQYEDARTRFISTQEALAKFRDQNRNLATARAETELQRLESEYNVAFDVYNSLAQQLEQARIKVQKDTPLFSTLEPAVLPRSPNIPDRTAIVVLSLFLGVFLSILVMGGIVVTKNVTESLRAS